EIPVARPWEPDSEHRAYKNTLEQAIAGEQAGFHSFWTVEHHFLEEYSHCSNPEVLYGAIAAKTSTMRLGYGVRLLPKPYNHPIRSAESAAVLDLLSDGRVEFGTGRSSTRAEIEGFDIDPQDTRAMCREGLDECEKPVGKEINDRAATFTMVHCADTNEQAFADAEESFPWYIKTAVRHIGSLVDWQAGKDLGTYSYAGHMAQLDKDGSLDHLDFEYLRESGSAVVGDPDRCVELAERSE